jgi:hypothetical protein
MLSTTDGSQTHYHQQSADKVVQDSSKKRRKSTGSLIVDLKIKPRKGRRKSDPTFNVDWSSHQLSAASCEYEESKIGVKSANWQSQDDNNTRLEEKERSTCMPQSSDMMVNSHHIPSHPDPSKLAYGQLERSGEQYQRSCQLDEVFEMADTATSGNVKHTSVIIDLTNVIPLQSMQLCRSTTLRHNDSIVVRKSKFQKASPVVIRNKNVVNGSGRRHVKVNRRQLETPRTLSLVEKTNIGRKKCMKRHLVSDWRRPAVSLCWERWDLVSDFTTIFADLPWSSSNPLHTLVPSDRQNCSSITLDHVHWPGYDKPTGDRGKTLKVPMVTNIRSGEMHPYIAKEYHGHCDIEIETVGGHGDSQTELSRGIQSDTELTQCQLYENFSSMLSCASADKVVDRLSSSQQGQQLTSAVHPVYSNYTQIVTSLAPLDLYSCTDCQAVDKVPCRSTNCSHDRRITQVLSTSAPPLQRLSLNSSSLVPSAKTTAKHQTRLLEPFTYFSPAAAAADGGVGGGGSGGSGGAAGGGVGGSGSDAAATAAGVGGSGGEEDLLQRCTCHQRISQGLTSPLEPVPSRDTLKLQREIETRQLDHTCQGHRHVFKLARTYSDRVKLNTDNRLLVSKT